MTLCITVKRSSTNTKSGLFQPCWFVKATDEVSNVSMMLALAMEDSHVA